MWMSHTEKHTSFSRPSMKASSGSSDESESHSDFLLVGLSGAGMYSSWDCCCSSSSSKYLDGRKNETIKRKPGRPTTRSSTHSSSVFARFLGTPHEVVMAEWLIAFKVEYPCLLSPLLAGGGGMATDRDDDDRPPELNENDILSFILLLCILKPVVMLVMFSPWDQLTMTRSTSATRNGCCRIWFRAVAVHRLSWTVSLFAGSCWSVGRYHVPPPY